MLLIKDESIYLAKDSVVGLADYFNGTDKDFSKVGVKALDDYTLQYTLNNQNLTGILR